VIDLPAKAGYDVVGVADPARIAVNVKNVTAPRGPRTIDVADGFVRRIRVNALPWGTQIVLDLAGKVTWSHFDLDAVDDMPHRIVVDLEPAPSAGPTAIPSGPVARAPAPSRLPRGASARDYVVAVDAGHGGSDPGAGRNGLVEKREALAIARRLAAEIDAQPGYRAFLTRDRDVFLSLPSRTQIAKDKGADIFVSVHLNSAPSQSARGIEVFFLSPAGAHSTAARLLSDKDRAAEELGLEEESREDILHMLVDVNQQSMMQRSSLLAEAIFKSMTRPDLPPTRTVKQRSFAVLKSIDIPSVMVETGFVTNAKDAKFLKSDAGKAKTAQAIAAGVLEFLKKHGPPLEQTPDVVMHRVRKGDTLWTISRKYNTSVASIQRSNRLGDSKTIRVGQELVIREGHEAY
jgi:N-acetylmuramoyl-L-alanine amidase